MDPLEARLRDYGSESSGVTASYFQGKREVSKAEYEKEHSHRKTIKWAIILGVGAGAVYFFGKPVMEWLTARNKRKEAEAVAGIQEPPGGAISDKVWMAEQIHAEMKKRGIFRGR